MTYFKLRSFTPEKTQKIILISNIIIAILGIVHWGCTSILILDCGILGRFVMLYKEITDNPTNGGLYGSFDQIKALFSTQIAFYAIAGIQQVLVSIGVILITKSYLGVTSKYYWLRIMLTLLLFNFAFNFTIGVYASMSSTYYFSLFKGYLQNVNMYLDGTLGEWMTLLVTFVYFTIAEAVITFVLGIPLIIVTVIALLEQSLKQEGNNTIMPERVTLQNITT